MPDASDFDELYTAHFARIAAQLHQYLGDRDEAQDLTQEAFCRALDHWSRVGRYEDPSAWVRRVAWNLATSRLRRLQVALRHLTRQREEHVSEPSPDRVLVNAALAELPAKHRLAVVLHHFADMSTSDIAEMQGVADGTVRSWLTRGRTELAERLADLRPDFEIIQPVGVAQTRATVRRRRRTRVAALATGLVLLIVLPILWLTKISADRTVPPPLVTPTPSDSVSPTPGQSPTPAPSATPGTSLPGPLRPVLVPGVRLDYAWLRFTDADHGYAFTAPCADGPGPGCRPTLLRTANRGQTWSKVDTPADTLVRQGDFFPLDGLTFGLRTLTGFELTRDGGKTYTHSGRTDLPYEIFRAANPDSGDWSVVCPDWAVWLVEDGPCLKPPQLVKWGVGPVRVLDFPSATRITIGKDGRVWASTGDENRSRYAVSQDGGVVFQELPSLGADAGLNLSADGKEAFALAEGSLWYLRNGSWVKQQTPTEALLRSLSPVGGRTLAVVYGDHARYWTDGQFTEIEMPSPDYLQMLPDGTLLVYGQRAVRISSPGTGTQRTWVTLTW